MSFAAFILPEDIWVEYYKKQSSKFDSFIEKYRGNKTVENFVSSQ